MSETFDKKCPCGFEFRTTRPQQTYCGYACYAKAATFRSKEYYKLLKAKQVPIGKVCPGCDTYFETTRVRVKYCSHECYRHVCLEKNREYSQAIRDEYKKVHPKDFKKKCELCDTEYDYRTKQGKYCETCAPLARKISAGQGPLTIGQTPSNPVVVHKCFVCGGPATEAEKPCKKCESGL